MKKGRRSLNRYQIILLILSILFAVFAYIGYSLEHTGQIIAPGTEIAAPFMIILLSVFFYFAITCIQRLSVKTNLNTEKIWEYRLFWLLLLNYLFYILLFYPGSVAHDTHSQLRQFLDMQAKSNANPIAVTVFYGVLFKIGRKLADPNMGVFLGCLAQAVLMAYAFSQVCCFVGRTTRSKRAALCTFAFFFIVPIWGGAAQTLLKDSLHVSIFVLFFLQFIRMFDPDCSRKDIALFVFWMLAAAVTRKASCYTVLVCGLVLVLYHQKNHRRRFMILTAAFWLIFSLYEYVLIPGIGIDEAPKQESYALQFQQVALVCVEHGDELSNEDIDIINSILDFEEIKRVYDPSIADPVKLLYHPDGSLQEFNGLYIRLLFRYPLTFLKATIQGSWKYFYPLSEGYEYFRSYISPNTLGIYRADEELMALVLKWAELWAERPILSLFIGPGLYTWLTIAAFALALAKKDKKAILITLPMIVFTLGMLVTPVNGENRYAYPIMALVPVLLACVHAAAAMSQKPVCELSVK